MARKAKFEKLHVLSWMITTAIMFAAYLVLAVVVEINKMEVPLFSKKCYDILITMYPGLTPSIKGAFIGFGYGILNGAFLGGIFAFMHNTIRKLFK